ncbi:MAG: hypothetical protein ACLFWM_05820 [Actinomycetota bacterium]
MAVFFGDMQMRDHPATMPAVVYVDKANIKIQSGKTQLGEWKLYQVVIEEVDPSTISFRVDDDELLLTLQEHESFLAETASYRRENRRTRRMPTHEAFRKEEEEGPGLGEEIREDVGREVSGVAEEIRDLWDKVYGGTAFWVGVGVVLLLAIFLPSLLLGVLFTVGVLSLVVGAIAYVETTVAIKLPDVLTPVRLVAIGVVCIGLGILVAIIR